MRAAPLCLTAWLLSGCIQPELGQAAAENGVVLIVSPADQPGEDSGAGAIVGMVVLGAAGGAVGEGAGKALAIAAGVIAGGIAGTAIETAGQHHDGIAYTVRLNDGQVVTIVEHLQSGEAIYKVGAAVTLETSGHDQRLVAQT